MRNIITTGYSLQDCYYREVWNGIGRGSRLTVEKWVTGNDRSFLREVVCDRVANRRDRVERIIYAIESTEHRANSWLHHVTRAMILKTPGAIDRYRAGVEMPANYWPSEEERVAFLKHWYWN